MQGAGWLLPCLTRILGLKSKRKGKAGIFQIHCRIKGKHEIMLKENSASIHILESIKIQKKKKSGNRFLFVCLFKVSLEN